MEFFRKLFNKKKYEVKNLEDKIVIVNEKEFEELLEDCNLNNGWYLIKSIKIIK
jgi:hypothetical protein